MKGRKNIFTILLFCLMLASCGKAKTAYDTGEIYKVLAKFISFEGGDNIHFAKFKIIKNLSDSLVVGDTIIVGYYNHREPDENIDNVLLSIKKYDGQTSVNNYFICPEYDGKINIQKAKIDYIDFDYWEGSETGKDESKPLTFSRTEKDNIYFLMMPCGGTETAITITGQNFNKELHLYSDKCPPILDLSNLRDGKYSANMRACGLGGTVTFNLKTMK